MLGIVRADVVEARFAFSGKVISVAKKPGEVVRVGELLASLDRKFLQTTLDRELADYEKARAEFEIFGIKNPNPGDGITKYQKIQAQASLDAAVKAVEIAKYNLDEADLKSPVNGIVLENNGLRAGMYVTPGASAYQILDVDTVHIEIEVEPEDKEFWENKELKLKIKAKETDMMGEVKAVVPNMKGKLLVNIRPETTDGLIVGCEVSLEKNE